MIGSVIKELDTWLISKITTHEEQNDADIFIHNDFDANGNFRNYKKTI